MTEREPQFWTCREDPERLYHADIGEAVYEFCDDTYPDTPPDAVQVYGWAPVVLPPAEHFADHHWRSPLAAFLETLDEEHHDPDDHEGSSPTEAMRAAEMEFLRVVLSEYKPWQCELVATETVRVRDHVDEEWLTDTPATEPTTHTHTDSAVPNHTHPGGQP